MSRPSPGPAPASVQDARALRQLLDGLSVGVLLYDLEGQLVDCNARARELLGLDARAMPSWSLGDAGHDAHPLPALAKLWPALARGEGKLADVRGPERDGAALELELRGGPLELEGASFVLIELGDVTAHRRRQAALADSKKQLEQAVLVRTRALQTKLRLIEAQRETLLQLSTPVIQVWDGVLVLPLIGELDSERAAQVTENILSALARTRSRDVIIDLTGVPEVSAAASSGLLATVRAARLLGARCLLSGISPASALALVGLDVELTGSVRVFADLQAALKAVVLGERAS